VDSSLAGNIAPLVLAGLLAGCAYGERFGIDGDDDSSDPAGCAQNSDCHDGDPLTTDLCGPGGTCEHQWIAEDTDPLSTDPADACEVAVTVGFTEQVTLVLDAVPGPLSHTLPLVQGKVVHLVLRDRQQLRIVPPDKPDDGSMLVLLSGCANAAANRVVWGGDIQSPFLDAGEYYLAVFSAVPRTIVLDVRYLDPVGCADSQVLQPGENAGTVDGHSDSFFGSCLPAGPDGHRGDDLYHFAIPEGEVRDLEVLLRSDGPDLAHTLFLRKGCAGPAAEEIACQAQGVELPCGTGNRSGTGIVLQATGLGPGAYTLFVDAAIPDAFELGGYRLEVSFSDWR
jgi:hypothetical protein